MAQSTPNIQLNKSVKRFMRRIAPLSFLNDNWDHIADIADITTTSSEDWTDEWVTIEWDTTEYLADSESESPKIVYVVQAEVHQSNEYNELEGQENPTGQGVSAPTLEKDKISETQSYEEIRGNQVDIQELQQPGVVRLRYGRQYTRTVSDPGSKTFQALLSDDVGRAAGNNITSKKEEKKKTMANITLVNNILHNNVPILAGEDSPRKQNEVNEFINCARLGYEILTDAPDKALFIRLLPTRLRGRALEAVQTNAADTIEEMLSTLRSNLLQGASYITLNTQLRNVQQLPTETLSGYFNRVKDLITACKHAADIQYSNGGEGLKAEIEEVGLHCFKMGVANSNYKFYLLQDADNTLEALGAKVRRLEQTEQCMRHPQQDTVSPSQQVNQGVGTNFYMGPIPRQPPYQPPLVNQQYPPRSYPTNRDEGPRYQQPRRNSFQIPSNSYRHGNQNTPRDRLDRRPIRCHFCNRTGHVMAECRTKQMTPFCPNCKTYGHTAQNCGPHGRNQPTSSNGHRGRQVNHTTTRVLEARCNFCLENGHREDRCYLKERWERLQLEQQATNSQVGNCEGATGHTVSRH